MEKIRFGKVVLVKVPGEEYPAIMVRLQRPLFGRVLYPTARCSDGSISVSQALEICRQKFPEFEIASVDTVVEDLGGAKVAS